MAILGNPILALEDERELILFKNGVIHSSLGGFRTVQGTVNSQTDSLTIENGKLVYYENDNDYGAILSNNGINVERFSKLRVTIDSILSWQDASKFWASVIVLNLASPATERLTAYGYSSYSGNAAVIQESGKRVEGSFTVDCNIPSWVRASGKLYNISVTCASGISAGINNGYFVISDIRLLV